MTREAMQAALDAMEIKQRVTLWETSDDQRRYVLALRGLRAALAAEPAQPVAPGYPPELSSTQRSPGPRFQMDSDGRHISDEDFIFDANLRISGDFKHFDQRIAYAQMLCRLLNAPEAAAPVAALAAEPSVTALQRFKSAAADAEPDPLERLRFFCSLAMTPRDWLDVEPFLDALTKDKS